MKVINSMDPQFKPSVVMMVYGEGGVGKTTFGATAPKAIIADCENGAKYFGMRGIKVDVAQIEKWSDMKEFLDYVKTNPVETIVIDPIGELMDKLKKYMIAMNDTKLVQKDGSPTMAGWGWLKKTMRDFIKVLRDTGKNVILVAHLEETKDEDRIVKRPKIETKISDDIVNMVDVVGYMTVTQSEGETKRIIIVDPGNDKYTAKDRTGQLGRIIEPDFEKIVKACQGTETYAWSKKPEEPKQPAKPAAKAPVAPVMKPDAVIPVEGNPADLSNAEAINTAEEVLEEMVDEVVEEMPQQEKPKTSLNESINKLKNFKKEEE